MGADATTTDTWHTPSHRNADHPGIHDLPADTLLPIFSLLTGKDIAICIRVCRYFAELIRADLYLRYKIELSLNGMVDGNSRDLSVSERMERLREYSSKFRKGAFACQAMDIVPGPFPEDSTSKWWAKRDCSIGLTSYLVGGSEWLLSLFSQGSPQAGIEPQRWLIPLDHLGTEEFVEVGECAVDVAQGVIVLELIRLDDLRIEALQVNFEAFSGEKTTPVAHLTTTQPPRELFLSQNVLTPQGVWTTSQVQKLRIVGKHVLCVFCDDEHEEENDQVIKVFDWTTGQAIWQKPFSTRFTDPVTAVVPEALDDNYLLVGALKSGSIAIYRYSPPSSDRPVCTLQLPCSDPEDVILTYRIRNSMPPSMSGGHFHADPSLSMVVVEFASEAHRGVEYSLLIPCATLYAQIRAAETYSSDSDNWLEGERVVPWRDWGPSGCLLLRVNWAEYIECNSIPFGSRMPLFLFGPDRSDGTPASVYVFDLNPLAARYVKDVLGARRERLGPETAAIVWDVDEALPGVVDPECSAIPYVVYRIEIQCPPEGMVIQAARMSLGGFTLIDYRESNFEAWSV